MFDVSGPESEVMLSLTQREPSEGIKKREPYVTIGMHVMRVELNRAYRIHQAIDPIETSDYANARSVFLHLSKLSPAR